MNAELALVLLVQAIDEKRERRVLLAKRDGERRTESMVLMSSIRTEYEQAWQIVNELRRS